MYDEEFAPRLISLRTKKNVSAREMSLAIGQSPSYITSIESGKALPSMSSFFFICDYLKITPSEFFDFNNSNPQLHRQLCNDIMKFDSETIEALAKFVNKVRN